MVGFVSDSSFLNAVAWALAIAIAESVVTVLYMKCYCARCSGHTLVNLSLLLRQMTVMYSIGLPFPTETLSDSPTSTTSTMSVCPESDTGALPHAKRQMKDRLANFTVCVPFMIQMQLICHNFSASSSACLRVQRRAQLLISTGRTRPRRPTCAASYCSI